MTYLVIRMYPYMVYIVTLIRTFISSGVLREQHSGSIVRQWKENKWNTSLKKSFKHSIHAGSNAAVLNVTVLQLELEVDPAWTKVFETNIIFKKTILRWYTWVVVWAAVHKQSYFNNHV